MFKSIREASDLGGKKVLVRVDWNGPLEDGKVVDDFRIKHSLATLNFLQEAGAKVIIATHLEPEDSGLEAFRQFVPEGAELLPNLRNDPREKANDPAFAQELAAKADIYVNEAFSASHREHASIVGVPKLLPHYAGLQFVSEVENLSKAFNSPRPFLFILGGAKFETKLPLVKKFQEIADDIFVAGANAKPASEMGFTGAPKITFPIGDIAALDADEANLNLLKQKIENSAFILWNGPLGKYEEGYVQGTQVLAKMLAESGKEVIIGGGDTVTAIQTLGLEDKFTFVSTGGGAMLDFLATGTLPGIEALN